MSSSRPIVAMFGLVLLLLSGLGGGWLLGRVRSQNSSAPTPPRLADASRPKLSVGTERNETPEPRRGAAGLNPVLSRSHPRFVDVAARHGIEFQYFRGETGEFWLPEAMGGGVAWLDFDGDGRLDLFFVQGCQLPRDDSGRFAAVLVRNAGTGAWDVVPRWAGPSNTGYGIGVAVADVNNDGFDDIYVTNFGPDTYWENNGDGTFSEQTAAAGLGCPLWGTSAAFGDLDLDGDLDLFVANYLHFDPSVVCTDPATGKRKYCGPDYFDGPPDVLYENRGDGRFDDVSKAAGIVRNDGKGLGVVIADLLGNDGVPEIFVANDLRPNFLFRNVTAGTDSLASPGISSLRFEEVGFQLGAAVNAEGVREANMGVACADYDEDGDLDLYVTHYYMEHDTLWENQGAHGFADVTKRAGLSLPTLRQLSWGTNFIDYDNDGWLDLFVTSGHINESEGGTIPYAMPPQLFHNQGGEGKPVRFAEVSARAGDYFQQQYVGRSSAAGDFDRDGDIDIVVGHHHKPAALLRNDSEKVGNAIGFVLVGRRSNRSAIGARITVTFRTPAGTERRLMREIVGGGSYLSADSREVLVGLGPVDQTETVRIRWPSGQIDEYKNLRAGGYWLVREGEAADRFRPFERADSDE